MTPSRGGAGTVPSWRIWISWWCLWASISNHLRFGESLDRKPLVFATNYFLKVDGTFLNEKVDKKVWLLWMEGRVHGEYEAVETPIGFIPRYEDIRDLFKTVFNREFTRADYDTQFAIRVDRFQEKLDRVEKAYRAEDDIPEEFYSSLEMLRGRLTSARERHGADAIPPSAME